MTRILIPFTDPQDAERAIRRLLDESPSLTTSVQATCSGRAPDAGQGQYLPVPSSGRSLGLCSRGALARRSRSTAEGCRHSV